MHSGTYHSGERWPTSRAGRIALIATLVPIGLLTMTPALVLLNPGTLASYGVIDPAPPVLALLQHRGVLQLALGAAIIWAAFDPAVRAALLLGATVTKGSGVLLTVTRPEVFQQASGNVGLWFDLVCIGLFPVIALLSLRRPAAVAIADAAPTSESESAR